jgi:hypothetical protein
MTHDRGADKRRDERYTLWFPVNVTTDDARQTLAVAKDASRSGIAISSPTGLETGARVTLSFRVPPDGGIEQNVTGIVARHERNPEDPHGLWPFRIGIAFEQPIPELEAILAETAKKSAS